MVKQQMDMSNKMSEFYVTSTEAAKVLGVTLATMSRWVKDGHIRGYRSDRYVLIRKDGLVRPILRRGGYRSGSPVRIQKEQLQRAYSNGYRTLQEIGNEFGVTRERIRQLVEKYGIEKDPRPLAKQYCPKCGEETEKSGRHCSHCRTIREALRYVELICGFCKKEFKLTQNDYKTRNREEVPNREGPRKIPMMCSSACFGRWMHRDREWGWGRKGLAREEKDRMIQLLGEGHTVIEIQTLIDPRRSLGTIYNVLRGMVRPLGREGIRISPNWLERTIPLLCSLCGGEYNISEAALQLTIARWGEGCNHYCAACYPKRPHYREMKVYSVAMP